MRVQTTKLDKVLVIEPPTLFEDFRGTHTELYNHELYHQVYGVDFIQDDISTSYKNVLRGIHGDEVTWKLISCLYGSFYLVVVNWDQDAPQYKQWISFTLTDRNRLQVLIPPKFGNGHLVLTETAIFHYKQSTYYDREKQFSIAWNDPNLVIYWPIKDPILSERDSRCLLS